MGQGDFSRFGIKAAADHGIQRHIMVGARKGL